MTADNVQQNARFDQMWQRGELHAAHIDALAVKIAHFHAQAVETVEDSAWGNPLSIYQPLADSLGQLREKLPEIPYHSTLERLTNWAATAYQRLESVLQARKRAGFIRQCQGDLRLCHLSWVNHEVVINDDKCIHTPIDVMNAVAALLVDLEINRAQALAARFLNAYLEQSGNYGGLAVLRFYQVYRALEQLQISTVPANHMYTDYLTLAERYAWSESQPFLMITYGVSGSGKSALTQTLLETLGVIRLRSDVERKRLFNLDPADRKGTTLSQGLYSVEASQMVFQGLEALAKRILRAGFPLIIDATFLQRAHRAPFRRLANTLAVPFIILECRAPENVVYERVLHRQRAENDPSDADAEVLKRQLVTQQPLGTDEQAVTITVNTGETIDISSLLARISTMVHLAVSL